MDSPVKSIRDKLNDELKAIRDAKPNAEQFNKLSEPSILTLNEEKESREAFIRGGFPEQIIYLKSIGKYYGE